MRHRQEQAALAVFDLCDTLYAANTTRGFLEYFGSATGSRSVLGAVSRWTSRRSPLFYFGALAMRLLGHDIARARMVASLRGQPRTTLVASARDYATFVLADQANAPLHKRLAEHHARGDRVMIVSSSLDFIVAAVAEKLGTEWRGSTVGFAGDRCTGTLIHDLTGKKVAAVRAAANSARLIVYTDNRSDRDLVKMADEATIVLPRRGKAEHWGGPDCAYLQL